MGIYCEFINLIIPIEKIDLVYPGGFLKFKEEHSQEFNGRMWHNKKLFRDGAMNYRDIEYLTEKWDARGLKGMSRPSMEKRNGKTIVS